VHPPTAEELRAEGEVREAVDRAMARYRAEPAFDPMPELKAQLARCATECRPLQHEAVRRALVTVETGPWDQVVALGRVERAERSELAFEERHDCLRAAVAQCGRTQCEWWVPARAWLQLGVLHAKEHDDTTAARRAFEKGLALCPSASPRGADPEVFRIFSQFRQETRERR
jgi:hypothetical protein